MESNTYKNCKFYDWTGYVIYIVKTFAYHLTVRLRGTWCPEFLYPAHLPGRKILPAAWSLAWHYVPSRTSCIRSPARSPPLAPWLRTRHCRRCFQLIYCTAPHLWWWRRWWSGYIDRVLCAGSEIGHKN